MVRRRSIRRKQRRYVKPPACQICKGETEVDYKNPTWLRQFISERGRILARVKTGTCAKHQRKLAKAIKRARHLALLPFVVKAK